MNERELLSRLGTRTQVAAEPKIDVVAQVLHEIQRRPAGVIDRRLSGMLICACALSASAILMTWSTKPTNDSFGVLAEAADDSTGPEAVRKVIAP
jgi:hypothetical protein